MPKGKDLGEKKSGKSVQGRKNPWLKDRAFIYLLTATITGVFVAFLLPRIWPEKPPRPEIEVAPVQYESQGQPLSEIIKHIEGKTDYDVIATKDVEEIKIYGSFEGNDWVHILKKIINAYDKQLRLDLDEKNKKITIGLKFVNE
jgi:hypothetical protein